MKALKVLENEGGPWKSWKMSISSFSATTLLVGSSYL